MRVVIAIVAILLIVLVLWLTGVGRSGQKTCVLACEETQCTKRVDGSLDCTAAEEAYSACLHACHQKHSHD